MTTAAAHPPQSERSSRGQDADRALRGRQLQGARLARGTGDAGSPPGPTTEGSCRGGARDTIRNSSTGLGFAPTDQPNGVSGHVGDPGDAHRPLWIGPQISTPRVACGIRRGCIRRGAPTRAHGVLGVVASGAMRRSGSSSVSSERGRHSSWGRGDCEARPFGIGKGWRLET